LLPSRTLAVTLELRRQCTKVPAAAHAWRAVGLGAVGTAEWTGVALHSVMERAWLPTAVEVLFRGADEGVPKDLGTRIAYERSLPIDVARGDDVLVAYAMNGKPIPPEHGGPLRLLVPGWYGMASVKWLAQIQVLDRPFAGFFQKDRYVIDGRPLRAIEPRAVITSPAEGADVSWGQLDVRGYAWFRSRTARPHRSHEKRRNTARLRQRFRRTRRSSHGMSSASVSRSIPANTSHRTPRPTATAIHSRSRLRWNALGYANNAVRPVRIRVRG